MEYNDEGVGVVVSLTVPREEDHFRGSDDDLEEDDDDREVTITRNESVKPTGSVSTNNSAKIAAQGNNNYPQILDPDE